MAISWQFTLEFYKKITREGQKTIEILWSITTDYNTIKYLKHT